MKELERILELWSAAQTAGESAVLATVVKTRGSSYRLPGARLLITQGGQRAGSISGGCLEEDLLKKAWWLTENGPVVRRYDTTADGEIAAGGFGLGCNGIIHVLLERLAPGRASALDIIRDVRTQRQPASIEHVLAPDEVWVETLQPATRLLVYGAGDDAVPLTELARNLGWEVWVFDGRAHYARREKFPRAHEVALRGARAVSIDPWTVAVIMSHSYSQDLEVLRELSSQRLSYLGVLGPAKRTAQLLADAGLDPAMLAPQMHAPMGLDIGADGPEQVALAVIAEIQSVLNGREGRSLSGRGGPIHSRETDDAVEKFEVRSIVCA
ncbi:MAG TPA: XdhC family protein [Bryobacteraceae bacterium]|nr:XdhC family protein [Bryobacteraceae bacterium]